MLRNLNGASPSQRKIRVTSQQNWSVSESCIRSATHDCVQVYAVGVMRRHRILHCDIKAENLLVDDNNHLVLADFGLAREFGHTEDERPWRSQEWIRKCNAPVKEEDEFGLKFGALVRQVHDLTCSTAGTPGYVPPEVWRGAGTRSYPGDIWAVGVTLYKMFTGRVSGRVGSFRRGS